jgi:hypothetical protein
VVFVFPFVLVGFFPSQSYMKLKWKKTIAQHNISCLHRVRDHFMLIFRSFLSF